MHEQAQLDEFDVFGLIFACYGANFHTSQLLTYNFVNDKLNLDVSQNLIIL